MLFKEDKWKVMPIGHTNSKTRYEMKGKSLEEVAEEHDIRVIMQHDLKCSKQCILVLLRSMVRFMLTASQF